MNHVGVRKIASRMGSDQGYTFRHVWVGRFFGYDIIQGKRALLAEEKSL